MGNYGEVAVKAVWSIRSGRCTKPESAWKKAIQQRSESQSTRCKGCPKNAFLGLCEKGMVRDIPRGDYIVSKGATKKNKEYAIKAVQILQKNSALCSNKSNLWRKVMAKVGGKISKTHNEQMDVVVSLWNNKLII